MREGRCWLAGAALGFLVFVAGALSLVETNTFSLPRGADAPAYERIARTMLSTGRLVLPGPDEIGEAPQMRTNDIFGSPWAMTIDGRLLPKHSVLFGLLVVPGVALAGTVGARVTALILGGLLAATATALAARRTGPGPALLAGAAVFLLSPGARNVVWAISVDTAIALAWFASLACLDRGRLAAAGLLAGLLPFLRPSAALLLAASVALLASRARGDWFRFAAGIGGPVALLAFLNTVWWGAPWRTSYDRVAVATGGGLEIARHSATFHGNPADGLSILFLEPAGSLLATIPVAVVGLAGLAAGRPGDRLPPVAVGTALLSLVALAPYDFLRVSPETAYRFALPFATASVLPIAALLATAARRLGERRKHGTERA